MSPNRWRVLFIYFLLIIFITNAVVVVWLIFLSSQNPSIVLSEPSVSSSSLICPGDVISYSYTMQVDRPASVDVSYSVVPEDGGSTSDSRLEQFIVDSPATIVLNRQWDVPPYFPDITHTKVPWEPGFYNLRIQARVTGNSHVEDFLVIPFELRRECPND